VPFPPSNWATGPTIHPPGISHFFFELLFTKRTYTLVYLVLGVWILAFGSNSFDPVYSRIKVPAQRIARITLEFLAPPPAPQRRKWLSIYNEARGTILE
jgi:hypothetical protein